MIIPMDLGSNQHKVLMVTHEFPPISGGQVMRMLKFAKFLPELGWQPIVVTAKPEDCYYILGWSLDPELLTQLSETVQVHRTTSPLERWARSIVNRSKRQPPNQLELASQKYVTSSISKKSLFNAVKRLHVFQDQSALWLPNAYLSALRLIKKEKPHALLTTSPPHLLQLIGYLLKRTTNISWVADFRDGWTDNSLFQSQSRVRQSFDNWLEQVVIRNADCVVVVTRHMQNSLQSRYPEHADKIRLIYNGYDSHDLADKSHPSNTQSRKISFCYVGNWGGFRNPSVLFSAFEDLFERKLLSQDHVTLSFTGGWHKDGCSVPNWVLVNPAVSHREALQTMINADVLILLADANEREAAFTSKVFEYLAAERPILGIIPEKGELADLLNDYSLGVVASPADKDHVRNAILKVYNIARSNQPLTVNDHTIIHKYDRQQQTRQLTQIFDSLKK